MGICYRISTRNIQPSKACLFALYFVAFKFGSVITYMVTPVAKFKSASSRTKILRLIV